MKKAKDRIEEKILSSIKNHGAYIAHVLGDEEHVRFSYTIGLYESYLHPEIIIIGLKHELSQILLSNMAYEIKEGKTFTTEEYHKGILDNFLCYFGDVPKSKYKEYVGLAIWFYEGYKFPLVQCVPPTVKGKFPWDKDFPNDARVFLQVITEIPKEH